MIDAKQFLDIVFAEKTEDEHICVSRATPKTKGDGVWFKNFTPADRQFKRWDASKQDQAWYFCVSTIDGGLNEKETMVGRGRANLKRFHCLVLDDIGTKASPPPVVPSWKLESSPDNYQWGYLLDPSDDFGRYEALVEYCHQQGWGDAGAGGSYRLVRLPGSANLKPGRQKFHSVITEDIDQSVWTLDELADELGCDFDKIKIPDRTISAKPGGVAALDGIDPMLDWLVDVGAVVRDDGSSWVDIICPWADAHTSGENTAGYSPLGRGSDNWLQTRAFKCLHEHCLERDLRALVKWAEKQGGPFVSGYDPLPWLQSRYTYVETGQMVYDLGQRPVGGVWGWTLADWKLKHPGRMTVPGHDKPILVANAFVESGDTSKAVGITYRPVRRNVDTGCVDEYGQRYVNTYVPPNWTETDETPEVFLEHIKYLVPDPVEREVYLNWLAYKIQHPASRSYAVVMVAENSYGTGRSWVKDMLSKVLQGGVKNATLSQLIGKGTSAEQNYNDWMVGCQFIVVEEAKDSGLTRDDFYHAYETFKLNVDTKVNEDVRINEKYGRTRHEHAYYNVQIFSNHADALALPENDRRVFCIDNPSERLDYDYYDRLTGALQTQEPRRVFWYLMRRDVSGYDHIYPPMTPAKLRMIEDTRAPSDALLDHLASEHAPDLVTKASLKTAIILAARDLDFEKIMREPGGMVKMVWRKLQTLRPENPKHGARYVIDNKQTEVRALRNRKKWVDQDKGRGQEFILAEFDKTEIVNDDK